MRQSMSQSQLGGFLSSSRDASFEKGLGFLKRGLGWRYGSCREQKSPAFWVRFGAPDLCKLSLRLR